MDFRNQVLALGALAKADADALLVVLTGTKPPQGLPRPIAGAIDAAVHHGDLALKASRTLYAGRVAGGSRASRRRG